MGEQRGCGPQGQRVTVKFDRFMRGAMEHRPAKTGLTGRRSQPVKWSEQSRNRRSWITWEGLNREFGDSDRKIKRKTGRLGQ